MSSVRQWWIFLLKGLVAQSHVCVGSARGKTSLTEVISSCTKRHSLKLCVNIDIGLSKTGETFRSRSLVLFQFNHIKLNPNAAFSVRDLRSVSTYNSERQKWPWANYKLGLWWILTCYGYIFLYRGVMKLYMAKENLNCILKKYKCEIPKHIITFERCQHPHESLLE